MWLRFLTGCLLGILGEGKLCGSLGFVIRTRVEERHFNPETLDPTSSLNVGGNQQPERITTISVI